MENAKVSILMPTYEPNPAFLCAALESILAQSEKNWTLLIHDDASTEDVLKTVKPYLLDERVTFKKSPERLGIGGNWNACLKTASTPFVQFLFQDDEWHPEYLEKALRIFERHPDIGFLSANHRYACSEGIETTPLYEELKAFKKTHLRDGPRDGKELLSWWTSHGLSPNVIGEPSFVMLRKSLTDAVGLFDAEMPQFLDSEYWVRCLARTNWYYLQEELGTFRVHHASASVQNTASGRGILDRKKTMKRALALLPPEAQRELGPVLQKQTRGMIRKFFERYAPEGSAVYDPDSAPAFFFLRHPLLLLRTGMRYLRRKKRSDLA